MKTAQLLADALHRRRSGTVDHVTCPASPSGSETVADMPGPQHAVGVRNVEAHRDRARRGVDLAADPRDHARRRSCPAAPRTSRSPLRRRCTRTASRSKTCATSHSVDRSPTRNSVFDGSASWPMTTSRSITVPAIGDLHRRAHCSPAAPPNLRSATPRRCTAASRLGERGVAPRSPRARGRAGRRRAGACASAFLRATSSRALAASTSARACASSGLSARRAAGPAVTSSPGFASTFSDARGDRRRDLRVRILVDAELARAPRRVSPAARACGLAGRDAQVAHHVGRDLDQLRLLVRLAAVRAGRRLLVGTAVRRSWCSWVRCLCRRSAAARERATTRALHGGTPATKRTGDRGIRERELALEVFAAAVEDLLARDEVVADRDLAGVDASSASSCSLSSSSGSTSRSNASTACFVGCVRRHRIGDLAFGDAHGGIASPRSAVRSCARCRSLVTLRAIPDRQREAEPAEHDAIAGPRGGSRRIARAPVAHSRPPARARRRRRHARDRARERRARSLQSRSLAAAAERACRAARACRSAQPPRGPRACQPMRRARRVDDCVAERARPSATRARFDVEIRDLAGLAAAAAPHSAAAVAKLLGALGLVRDLTREDRVVERERHLEVEIAQRHVALGLRMRRVPRRRAACARRAARARGSARTSHRHRADALAIEARTDDRPRSRGSRRTSRSRPTTAASACAIRPASRDRARRDADVRVRAPRQIELDGLGGRRNRMK